MAREAGTCILASLGERHRIEHKDLVDLVTDVDKKVEKLVLGRIRRNYPGHDILAEESGAETGNGEFRWVIDPIDGTTNFVHGYPCFAVSIAIQYRQETRAGVVFNPVADEMFCALKGQGAFLNGRRIAVSTTADLSSALLATGFPYRIGDHWHRAMDLFKLFYYRTQGVRRDGSAALDLCHLAAGRFDGFWEYDLHPWDVAAGLLIVAEAGGRCSDFSGTPGPLDGGQILASNGPLHGEMLRVIQSLTD
jgi:myo-inositol-1(or 4)-monophosphatase